MMSRGRIKIFKNFLFSVFLSKNRRGTGFLADVGLFAGHLAYEMFDVLLAHGIYERAMVHIRLNAFHNFYFIAINMPSFRHRLTWKCVFKRNPSKIGLFLRS